MFNAVRFKKVRGGANGPNRTYVNVKALVVVRVALGDRIGSSSNEGVVVRDVGGETPDKGRRTSVLVNLGEESSGRRLRNTTMSDQSVSASFILTKETYEVSGPPEPSSMSLQAMGADKYR